VVDSNQLRQFLEWICEQDASINTAEFCVVGWVVRENDDYIVIVPVMPFVEFGMVSKMILMAFHINKGSIIERFVLTRKKDAGEAKQRGAGGATPSPSRP